MLKCSLDVANTRAWPTSTPEAAEALAVAAESYCVCPLPAYDQNANLLEPQDYMKRLDGANVIIRFELSHYLIRGKKDGPATDIFSARVVQVRIILPPPGTPATPRKKKILPRDNYFGSFTPTKRKRENDDDDKENHRSSKTARYVICFVI